MKNKKDKKEISKTVNEITSFKASKTDPNGSWTGVPVDENEKPQQDADDL